MGVEFGLGFGSGASPLARGILRTGETYLGTRYVWGGSNPTQGFDCSGFVQFVYAAHGISLPRVTRDQVRVGRKLTLEERAFRAGDLLFFAGDGRTIDHVAIYAGDGRLLHATEASGRVRFDMLDGWYARHLVAARRVL